jgi:uncharacterized RDD family membrane protein YckC
MPPAQPPAEFVPIQPSVTGALVPPFTFTMPVTPAYAGFWLRLAAALIDGILLFVALLIIFTPIAFVLGVFGALSRLPQNSIDQLTSLYSFAANILGTFLGWLYYAGMESSSRQATLGKMAVGIKVTDLNGNRISFGRATGRHFAKWVSDLTFIFLGFGFWMTAFTEKKQALHDMIAGTLVVKK